MADSETINTCKSCGFSGAGDYCSRCGHQYKTKRISISGLLHDILHFFTHLEKGFGYTLKQLIIAPGHMQRTYIEGERSKHQKPFSMFIICASISAVSRYWILKALLKYYHAADISEANFFHEYIVVLYIALVPVFALLGYLFFYKSGYNYAEMGVWILYTVSVLFLGAIFIALTRFAWPFQDSAYIEFPVFCVYFTITAVNFFKKLSRWEVVIKSLIIMTIIFLLNQVLEDFAVHLISRS